MKRTLSVGAIAVLSMLAFGFGRWVAYDAVIGVSPSVVTVPLAPVSSPFVIENPQYPMSLMFLVGECDRVTSVDVVDQADNAVLTRWQGVAHSENVFVTVQPDAALRAGSYRVDIGLCEARSFHIQLAL